MIKNRWHSVAGIAALALMAVWGPGLARGQGGEVGERIGGTEQAGEADQGAAAEG